MKESLLILIVGLAFISSCAQRPQVEAKSNPPVKEQPEMLTEAKVTEIARQAVIANDTWAANAEFESPKRQANGSWQVMVWRLPKVPSGHRIISIDAKGKVTAYFRGR